MLQIIVQILNHMIYLYLQSLNVLKKSILSSESNLFITVYNVNRIYYVHTAVFAFIKVIIFQNILFKIVIAFVMKKKKNLNLLNLMYFQYQKNQGMPILFIAMKTDKD